MLYKDIINPFIIPNRTLQYSTHFYDFQFGGYFAYYQAREEGSEYVNVTVDCEALLSMTIELRVWLKVLVDSIKYYCPLARREMAKHLMISERIYRETSDAIYCLLSRLKTDTVLTWSYRSTLSRRRAAGEYK